MCTLIKIGFVSLVAVVMAAALHGASKSIIEHSPFLPTGYHSAQDVPPAPIQATIEKPMMAGIQLKGVMKMGNEWFFSFYDAAQGRSSWVCLGDRTSFGGIVASYDEYSQTVQIRMNGKTCPVQLLDADSAGIALTESSYDYPDTQPDGSALISFNSLSAKAQAGMNSPEFIPVLIESGIEVPLELRRRAISEGYGRGASSGSSTSAQARTSETAKSSTPANSSTLSEQRVLAVPKVNNAFTTEQKRLWKMND